MHPVSATIARFTKMALNRADSAARRMSHESASENPAPAAKKRKDSAQQRFALSDVEGEWELPPLSLIQDVPPDVMSHTPDEAALRRNAELLQSVLADFNIQGEIRRIAKT